VKSTLKGNHNYTLKHLKCNGVSNQNDRKLILLKYYFKIYIKIIYLKKIIFDIKALKNLKIK
jgi:hypothetical protein